jgi:hypothetical protein
MRVESCLFGKFGVERRGCGIVIETCNNRDIGKQQKTIESVNGCGRKYPARLQGADFWTSLD